MNGKSSIKSLFNNIVPKKKETSVKLDEDDILSGILDELDTSKPKSSEEQQKNSKTNDESRMFQEYLKNFTRNVKKPSLAKKVDDTSDDEMLDRIMKPVKKVTSLPATSVPVQKNGTELVSTKVSTRTKSTDEFNDDDYVFDVATAASPHPVTESDDVEIPTVENIDHAAEADFSMLDDDENQFEIDKIISKAAESVCKPVANVESTNFDELFSNWENFENCNDDFMNVTIGDEIDLKNDVNFQVFQVFII